MTQHSDLTPERWARFDLGQQILQIGVEMQRATRSLRPDRLESLRLSYERTMQLVDLTVEVQTHRNLRRELLRWRDVVAELYLQGEPDPAPHRHALETLYRLHPVSATQVAFLPA
jgi:hypothetical protein